MSAGRAPIQRSQQLAGLCALAVRTLPYDGASVVLTSSRHRSYLAGVGELSEALAELQTTTSEGPAAAADDLDTPVLVNKLDTESCHHNWPVYTVSALGLGAAAVFAFPLRIGVIKLGVLAAYRVTEGELTAVELTRTLQIADSCAYAVLDMFVPAGRGEGNDPADPLPAEMPADRSQLADGAQIADDPIATFVGVEVHQASGMLMVQLDLPIDAALARLRAYAFALDRPLAEVAHDVVTRRLVFER
jgi:hypothetical protein